MIFLGLFLQLFFYILIISNFTDFSLHIYIYSKSEHVDFCVTDWPLNWNFTDNSSKLSIFINTYLTPIYAFQIYSLLFNYILPVGIIVILYCNILRRLHKKSKIKKSKTKSKSHRKITRMVLCIVICYLMCWTPYWYNFLCFINNKYHK